MQAVPQSVPALLACLMEGAGCGKAPLGLDQGSGPCSGKAEAVCPVTVIGACCGRSATTAVAGGCCPAELLTAPDGAPIGVPAEYVGSVHSNSSKEQSAQGEHCPRTSVYARSHGCGTPLAKARCASKVIQLLQVTDLPFCTQTESQPPQTV